MKKETREPLSNDPHTGCFGAFDINDRICKSFCALRLRCTIEMERSLRLEILEELVSVDQMLNRIQ